MTRSLDKVASMIDGFNKINKADSDSSKKIALLFNMESKAQLCGNFERVKLLKKRQDALEEKLLEV
jgi:hypothetical protein